MDTVNKHKQDLKKMEHSYERGLKKKSLPKWSRGWGSFLLPWRNSVTEYLIAFNIQALWFKTIFCLNWWWMQKHERWAGFGSFPVLSLWRLESRKTPYCLVNSSNKYLLNTYYVPYSVLCTRDAAGQGKRSSCY